MMKLVFFGTPEYVIPILDTLKNSGYEITAVVTQSAKPIGRKKIITSSHVSRWAKGHNIQSIENQPKELFNRLKGLKAGLGVLAAYGKILPPDVVNLFALGIINIHPSLLPKYRGASPVEATIVSGDKQTGVTIIKLDEEMDHGPILLQFIEPIQFNDTKETLRARLFQKAAEKLVTILPAYRQGKIELKKQNHSQATFTTLLKKEHGYIPPKYLDSVMRGKTLKEKWQIPFIKNLTIHPSPITIHNFIRSMDPWPGAFTKLKMKNEKLKILKLLKVHLEKSLIIDRVQLEGKKSVSWEQFITGYPEAKFV